MRPVRVTNFILKDSIESRVCALLLAAPSPAPIGTAIDIDDGPAVWPVRSSGTRLDYHWRISIPYLICPMRRPRRTNTGRHDDARRARQGQDRGGPKRGGPPVLRPPAAPKYLGLAEEEGARQGQ